MSSETQTLVGQVARLLRSRIADGTYAVESRLPPMRELAAEQDVSLHVIQQAVQQLARDGLVRSAHGSGVRVISAEGAEILDVAQVLDQYGRMLREHDRQIRELQDEVRRLRGEP